MIAGRSWLLVLAALVVLCGALGLRPAPSTAQAAEESYPPGLPPQMVAAMKQAAANYERYCALCHGSDRKGYRNDSAPSLRSPSLFLRAPMPTVMAIAYGRPGTPMGPYIDEMGGPMTQMELRSMVQWLMFKEGRPFTPPSLDDLAPVRGNIEVGETIYAKSCAGCHGAKGEGGIGKVHGTALGNPTMLAVTPDAYLKDAIVHGREGTIMPAWQGILSDVEIDAVVAFLRSRASGWTAPQGPAPTPPAAGDYVINPEGKAGQFTLEDGRYIKAEQLSAAIGEGRRMVLLDTRVPAFWAMAHIEGSVPVPYYSDFDTIVANLPTDGTWIVAYCECPRAAADHTVDQLRQRGFKNTAVLWEGYAGWSAKGFPVVTGTVPDR